MPELDRLFQDLHRRRTAGEKLVAIYRGRREMGRIDRYVDRYQGKEYPVGALEVITMAFQYVTKLSDSALDPISPSCWTRTPKCSI